MSNKTNSNEIQAYQKVTIGFVVQHYRLNKEGKYACSWQSFEAADQVTREDDDGDPVQIDISREVYQAMDMEQPAPERDAPKSTIQIVIAGGAVQSVTKPKGITLEIRDYDVDGADIDNTDIYKQDKEGDWYQRMFWDENEMEG